MIGIARLLSTDPTLPLITVVSAGVAAYLGAYLRQKGQNTATHEDLGKLIDQVKATTEATKAIEDRIAGATWNRQRQWEMKRDALVAALEPISRADDMLIKLTTAYAQARDSTPRDPEAVRQYQIAAMHEYQREINLFDERRRILALMCNKRTTDAFFRVSKEMRATASLTFKGHIESYGDVARPIQEAIHLAIVGARVELGISFDGDTSTAVDQSSQSSANKGDN